jgi:predicted metalloendopeptidase
MDIVIRMSPDVFTLFASVEQKPELVPVIRDYMIYSVISQDAFCIPKLAAKTDRFDILDNLLHYNKYYKYRILTETLGRDNIYKQQCIDILENMRKTFIRRVDNLDWMSDATKAEAKRKAEAMSFYVGYPDEWNDDMTPQADGDCLLAAVTQMRQHEVEVSKQMIGGNYDELGWDFMASTRLFSTDNAFHLKPVNSLVILPTWVTKPRFDSELSEATLYAVAITFGHEFCHGFDAKGSLVDADGNAHDSWTPADRQAFEAKQQMMIELFNQLEDYPGQPADGAQTLDENLADYGGVELALDCYKQRLREQGFTGEQFDEQIKKFFLAYSQMWKDDYERSLEGLKQMHDRKDNHSLNHVRVNGMMRLQDDWYRLYDVKPTDKLYLAPEQRVKIW